jgi:hypothetical protein
MMFDGWMDEKGTTLLNFLVYCPRSVMFIKFVDASMHVKMQNCCVNCSMGVSKR